LKTSVIIPSYNPELKLPYTLNALVSQKQWIDELVIVIDKRNFTSGSKIILEKFATVFNLKVIPQDVSGRGRSRNKGVDDSPGDLLIFLDDDMLAENGLIEKHINYHRMSPGIIVSGSGYRNPSMGGYDFGKFLLMMEKVWKKGFDKPVEVKLEKFNFTASNLSVSKEIFLRLGGFDTRFSDGEDFDFGIRAINTGIKVLYDINLLAWHNDWPGLMAYSKRQNEYALAKLEIARVHPEYLKHFPYLIATKSGRARKFISSIIRGIYNNGNVPGISLFRKLPLKIKFLFYNLVISSYSENNK
jgi:GT2 family glycosyltransferase